VKQISLAQSLLLVSLACLSLFGAHAEDRDAPAGDTLYETRSVEQYRFLLGGFSGHYTQWERTGLERFDGLSAKIWVDEVYGNEDDRWASIVRFSFWEPGSTDTQPKWSLMFTADRATKRIVPNYLYGEDHFRLDTDFPLKQPISLTLLVNPTGGFLVSLDGQVYELPGDMKVGRVEVLASGVDARVDPFTFEQRIQPAATDAAIP